MSKKKEIDAHLRPRDQLERLGWANKDATDSAVLQVRLKGSLMHLTFSFTTNQHGLRLL